jgi:hypothetical protein
LPKKDSTKPSVLQNQQEVSAIFLWLILNVPLFTAALQNNTFSLRMRRESSKWRGTVVCFLSKNSHGLFYPTHHTAQKFLPRIFTSLEPSKLPSSEEVAASKTLN